MDIPSPRHWAMLRRLVIFGFAAVALSGCIIVPEHHWHPYYYH
jgi:hypothetical protein